ncbi:protein lifeguard 1-like [Oncorhynchus keta]|uniref:protein lifeguard 1-like n=1 Tax=Oncorhynchus keta TaxID=8018 RepID=UPI00227A8A29|nr:protein lifeguard 1-like [Oncorhynchus keta]
MNFEQPPPYQAPGYPQQGYPQQGYPQQGYPPQGYPVNMEQPGGFPPQNPGYPAGPGGPPGPYPGQGQAGPYQEGYPGQPQFGWQGGPPPGPMYGEAPKNTGERENEESGRGVRGGKEVGEGGG